jgi:hypothetical protein
MGKGQGRVGLAETEVAWVVGPVGDIELVGALALALPGLGQVCASTAIKPSSLQASSAAR